MSKYRMTPLMLVAAALTLAACEEGVDLGVEPTEDAQIELALEQMVAEANSAGDADAAASFSDGLVAIRLGARPTEIGVSIDGELVRYQAVVTGIVRARGSALVMHRSLVAWTGQPRVTAVLQVSSFTDQAVFGFPARLTTTDVVGRARGTWADLERGHRFVATDGSAALQVASQGDPCPNQPNDSSLRCVLARWNIRVDGDFHLLLRRDDAEADQGRRLEIKTAEDGVSGIVVTR